MFTFVQLKSFVVVAEELHFGRAAERLRITQPPLSRQIRRLEEEVGFSLLDRTKRQVTLTVAGTAFLEEARKLLSLADRSQDMAERISTGQSGVASIGMTGTGILAMLTLLIDDLNEHAPELELEVLEMVTKDQISAILNGTIDVGLLRTPPNHDELESVVVHTERLMAAVSSRHPLGVSTAPLDTRDLAGEVMVDYAPAQGKYLHDLVKATLRDVPVTFRQQVTQVQSALAFVVANSGLAFVPESAMHMQMVGVVYRPIAGLQDPIMPLHAAWRRDNANPALRVIVKRLFQLRKRGVTRNPMYHDGKLLAGFEVIMGERSADPAREEPPQEVCT
ncbi:LysR family transcriptional regulator [Leucobacter sp. GX24907]